MDILKPARNYPLMSNPQAQPRYVGIPTFFRAPHTQDLSQVDIGLIGVPFDGGVTNRPGARHGPREVRNQSSLLRPINTATGAQPFNDLRIRDLGDCWIEDTYALTNATLPYAVALVDKGWRAALEADHALALGLNTYDGRVTFPGVAEAFDLECTPVDEVLR